MSEAQLNKRIKTVLLINLAIVILIVALFSFAFSSVKAEICIEDGSEALASCNAGSGFADVFLEFLFIGLLIFGIMILMTAFVALIVRMVITGATGRSQSFKYYWNWVLWINLGLSLLGFGIV